MKNLLLNYVKANLWSNTRITDKLSAVDPEIWVREHKSSFKSIRETLLHIADAQAVWHSRLHGTSPTKWPSADFSGTNEEAANRLLISSEAFVTHVSAMNDEDLLATCTFNTIAGQQVSMKVHDVLLHCMNHSTFHRGQIVNMLRASGVDEIPPTDYLVYVRSNAGNG